MTSLAGHDPPAATFAVAMDSLGALRQAVTSLYQDQIRPTQSDISRRMAELGFANVALGEILEIAGRGSPEFVIVVDDGLQISIELKVCPTWFIGWIDPNDNLFTYSMEIWDLFEHYVGHLSRLGKRGSADEVGAGNLMSYQVKGGRYGLAKKLFDEMKAKNSSLLKGCVECFQLQELMGSFSVGRLCHLVQQAISKGILRYEDNLLQPSACCKMPSAALAARLIQDLDTLSVGRVAPKAAAVVVTREVSCLDELKGYLWKILKCQERLPISQLKKRMITDFQVVLNPIKFGFTKLSDLLRQVEFVALVTGPPQNSSFLCLNELFDRTLRRS